MQLRIFIMIIIVLGCITISASAQENRKAEDILRYFPEGVYQYLAHHDYFGHADQPAYALYKKYRGLEAEIHGNSVGKKRLPERFYSGDYSITFAELFLRSIEKRELIRVDDPTNREAVTKEIEKVSRKYPDFHNMIDQQVSKPEDGELELIFRRYIGDSLTVFRSTNLPDLLKNALLAGEIEKTGKKIRKKPVYRMKGRGRRNQSQPFYLFATAFDELLISTHVKGIRKMLAVAEGNAPGILEDNRYSGLVEAIPDLSLYWTASFPQLSFKRILDLRKSFGMSEEELKNDERYIREAPWVEIATTRISDEIIWNTISIYENEEIARVKFKPKQPVPAVGARGDMPDEFYTFVKLEHARTTIKLDGNWIIKSVVWDEEFLRQRHEYYVAMEEFQQEQRKKMEELEAAAKAAQNKEKDK